jgi:murein DD-endopeptidase MepM/ murein hydrolase activator NlpD
MSVMSAGLQAPPTPGPAAAVLGARSAGLDRGEAGRPSPSAEHAAAAPPTVAGTPPGAARFAEREWPTPPGSLTGYLWPVAKSRLTLPFGPTRLGSRVVGDRRFHDGIDLATFCGDRVVAAHAGIVLAAGRRYDAWMGWRGSLDPYEDRLTEKQLWITLPIVIVIDDGNGYRSVYAHLKRVVVRAGQEVRAGQLLGYEGRTGRASGCHLHYGLFSPLEERTFALRADIAERMLLPAGETARVDPLLVLPPRPGDPTPIGDPFADPGDR